MSPSSSILSPGWPSASARLAMWSGTRTIAVTRTQMIIRAVRVPAPMVGLRVEAGSIPLPSTDGRRAPVGNRAGNSSLPTRTIQRRFYPTRYYPRKMGLGAAASRRASAANSPHLSSPPSTTTETPFS
ncbi:hypothetical protein EMPG_15076 [Blastomyces silverae]|uniref:Uncharacterized protein n=1 Tax=Blastomyces silverae TaxID=2060906 RepID=A0A0H1BDH9_9EURO|nr:hypothetical protein EMPG_15076 [Blastomyces silverae]